MPPQKNIIMIYPSDKNLPLYDKRIFYVWIRRIMLLVMIFTFLICISSAVLLAKAIASASFLSAFIGAFVAPSAYSRIEYEKRLSLE